MGNWKQWIEEEDDGEYRYKRVNKEVCCKKNKLGNDRYGNHVYDNFDCCTLCGHVKKEGELE